MLCRKPFLEHPPDCILKKLDCIKNRLNCIKNVHISWSDEGEIDEIVFNDENNHVEVFDTLMIIVVALNMYLPYFMSYGIADEAGTNLYLKLRTKEI